MLILQVCLIFFQSCLDLRDCPANVIGKYYCYNNPGATNSLELLENGDFIHLYKIENRTYLDKGKWERSKKGSCQILLSNWKNYNEVGDKFEDFGNGILFINGAYLDMTPDGNSSTSFKK